MKILVVGSGGREHALVWKIAQSPRVKKIFCAPGNAGISSIAECVKLRADDGAGLLKFARDEAIDLTVVGPEAPLVDGIVDHFQRQGLKIFGPVRDAARLEASKDFTGKIAVSSRIPTGRSYSSSALQGVMDAVRDLGLPVVIKADGLAAGKGVVICQTEEAASQAAIGMLQERIFGEAGKTVIIQEFLNGEEASILALTDGTELIPLASAQDHKRVYDQDKGPNTGGMGAYSPAPVVTPELLDVVTKKILLPTLQALKQMGITYRGVLYAGIMVTKDGPQLLEYNVRFGDPETQAVLARLESDLVEAMLWTIGEAPKPVLKWSPKASVCVVVSSGGYPGRYEAGLPISGLEEASRIKDVVVFHAGTKSSEGACVTDGGRVLGVTALGGDVGAAINQAYAAVNLIHFNKMHFRRDIGWRAMERVKH